MKIALILGRGVEGAGVTRYMIEICGFLRSQDIEHQVYVMDDKKWGRGKAQDMPPYKDITKENIGTIHEELNKFDIVFLNSVPSVKGHSEWAKDGFLNMVKNLSTKKVVFQNDHKIQSIHRNANFFEICSLVDGIVSHSITSPFYKKLVNLFGAEIRNKFIQLHVGFDFEPLSRFKKDQHFKKVTYLGRFATFKNPERLYGLLPYTEKNNILLEMRGVERSLGALPIFYEFEGRKMTRIPRKEMIECNPKAIQNGLVIDDDKRDLSKVYIFGPYEYNEGMEALSTSLVGTDFYHLAADAYGDNIEYAQCEIIAVGCVGLYDYHWAEHCYVYDNNGKNTGKRFIDLENTYLYLKKDLSNAEELIDKINDIYSNKKLHKQYLENGLEVMKAHANSQWIFQKLVDDVVALTETKLVKSKSLF